MKQRLEQWRENFGVWWFMLDAQQKQAVIIATIALWEGIVQLVVARLSGTKSEGAAKAEQ